MNFLDNCLEFLSSFKEESTDSKFREYLTKVRPMTGAGIVTVLNKCVSLIEDIENQCYFEVGIHRGSTLIGAALDNKAMCYGVDNFEGHNAPHEISPFKSVEEGLDDAIARLSSGNIKYWKSDFKEFIKNKENIDGKKIAVYFYDGDHSWRQTYEGLHFIIPLLADEAIVFLDDSANNDREEIITAYKRILSEDARFTFIKEWIPKAIHKDMWCGLVALEFNRNL